MKVLIFSKEFPPQLGGAGVVAKEYAELFAKRGCQVTVLTEKRKQGRRGPDQPYSLIEVNASHLLWPLAFLNKVEFSAFDLIILNDPPSCFFAGLFFRTSVLEKSVIFLHGSEPEMVYFRPTFVRKIFFFRRFYSKALEKCRLVVAVSEYMKQKFISELSMEPLLHKFLVLYSPVNRNLFYPDFDSSLKKRLGISESSKVLLSVSRVVRGKGFERMLSLFETVNQVLEDSWSWVIVGSGEYLNEFKATVVRRKMEDRVFFLGEVPRENLRRIYSSADLFWMLSDFKEAFGLVYVEAQMCGCIPIGYKRFGVVEAIRDQESGFLVSSEQDLIDIFVERKWEKIEVGKLFENAEKFTEEALWPSVEKLFCQASSKSLPL